MSNPYKREINSAIDITDVSASGLVVAMRRAEVSPVEVIDAYIDRIERVNPALNAIVTLRGDEARAEAVAAERARRRGDRRPLLGVPFTVKDVIATAGVRTTCGSRLFATHVPTADATCVARLRAAGAILLGKTNCPEFALDPQTDNLLFGPTRNPWDYARTPGGSSGGESATIAAGCSALGVGTDFGGSLRFPAHCTGITALRPTAGLVPATGSLPSTSLLQPAPPNSMSFQGQLQVVGPLARCVNDLSLALGILAGPDNIDALAVPVPLHRPEEVDLRQIQYAWCTGDGSYPVRSDIIRAIEEVALHLSGLGLSVVHARPPNFERAEPLFARIRAMDGLADLRTIVGGHDSELSPWVQHLLAEARTETVPALLSASAERDRLRVEFLEFMSAHQVLLLPVAALPAFPLGQRSFDVDGVDLPYLQVGACCRAVSLFGCPSVVVTCGRSREGLPIGVQIVCAPFMDHVALAVAGLIEQEYGAVRPGPIRQSTALKDGIPLCTEPHTPDHGTTKSP